MRAYFDKLSAREQRLVAVLGALLALLIIVYGLIVPILTLRSEAVADYTQAQRLERLTRGLQAPGQESSEDRALRSVITERADRSGLTYTRINQTPQGGVQIDLANVPHSAFFAWLETLQNEEQIVVVEAFVEAGDAAGSVEARLTLVREE